MSNPATLTVTPFLKAGPNGRLATVDCRHALKSNVDLRPLTLADLIKAVSASGGTK